MKAFGICKQSLLAVRQQPSHRSEMTNQLLFGELIYVLDKLDSWFLIASAHDNYEGWVDLRQVTLLPEEEFILLNQSPTACLTSLHGRALCTGRPDIHLLLGSKLPEVNENKLVISDKTFTIDGEIGQPDEQINAAQLVGDAQRFLGSPYLWGGRSLFGIDCSGLVQVVFGLQGINLPRDSSMQVRLGHSVDFISEAMAGDLAFFDNQEEEIVHVGMMIDSRTVIHASGEVRIDGIDHYGIYNAQSQNYSHKLRIIKRLS